MLGKIVLLFVLLIGVVLLVRFVMSKIHKKIEREEHRYKLKKEAEDIMKGYRDD